MLLFDELKSMAKIFQEAGKIDLYQKVLEIQEKFLDIQKEKQLLEEENKKLKKKLEIKGKIYYRDNAYWFKDIEKKENGPYCSHCWEAEEKLIHSHPTYPGSKFFECPHCKTVIKIIDADKNETDILQPRIMPKRNNYI